ncbi:GcrA family cell cycle regulator [Bradyrhizobium oligotrophicum]|uniref:GcrA family cell cycle regulator n=1 Tax=Bradyrhizobium oligotrophicum TaxID=44255 RepID=UPI000A069BF4|nr:GcrA family cell cycle regulator [Bradyrhizobium oligotrophicum]
MGVVWTDEREAQLVKMWHAGLTTSQIAAELGNVTRNAVVSKAARLGLQRRQAPPPVPRRAGWWSRRFGAGEVAEPPPVVPTLRPAAIEPLIRRDKLSLPTRLVKSDLDERAIKAALRALRQQLKELAADLAHAVNAGHSPNIDKRVISFLQKLSDRIPTGRPTQDVLFLLGHEQETLEHYAATANDEWPPLLSGRYLSVTRAFDRTLRQFPKWRLFKQNASRDRLTSEQTQRALELSVDFSHALCEPDAREQVDQQLPDTLNGLRQRLPSGTTDASEDLLAFDIVVRGSNELADDLITSMDNVVKLIADIALAGAKALFDAGVASSTLARDAAAAFWKTARPSIVDSAGKAGKAVGPRLILWCTRILRAAATVGAVKLTGLAGAIARLVDVFPDTFGWIHPILRFLQ